MVKLEQRIHKLFTTHPVLDMPTLQQHLEKRSKRSIFRDLAGLEYYSSYTHSGKYFSLKNTPSFNSNGIWFYEQIGFSQYGTLKKTLIEFIKRSEAGKVHDELKKELRINVHNTLLDLVKNNQITRVSINKFYVYLSANEIKSATQLEKRHQLIATKKPTILLPSALLRIEIFSEIIKAGQITFNERDVLLRLKHRGVEVCMEDLERVLIYYDIKKNCV